MKHPSFRNDHLQDAFIVHYELDAKVIIPVETLESAFLCSLICWVYGVQRFSDDIHFMVGTQPAKYWKICWYIMPVVQWVIQFFRGP